MVEKKRDTSKKRTSILDAAVKAFQKLGYDNASMDYIAEVAGASKRTVYNHFSSKEILFQEVLSRFIDETSELKQIAYSSKRSLESQLKEFAQAKLGIANSPSWLGLMKVTTGVFITHPELAAETMAKAEDREDTLATWLAAASDDGKLTVENPIFAASVFWAMVGGAFFWPAIFMGPMESKEADEMTTELIQMFLARYSH